MTPFCLYRVRRVKQKLWNAAAFGCDLINASSDPGMQRRISARLNIMIFGHAAAVITAHFDPKLSFNAFLLVVAIGGVIFRRTRKSPQPENAQTS